MAKLKFDDIEEYKEEKKIEQTISLGTIVEIPIDLVSIGENIRNVNEDDESKLRQIGESIKADGQIEPCIVYQQGDRYIIKAGSRRYKACVLCEVPTLKCIVDKKFSDEKERIIYQATENEHRENMNSREREAYMSRLIDLGMSQLEIAKALHKNKGWVSEALTAHNLLEKNSDLNNLIKDDEMSTRDAWELSKMDEDTLNTLKDNVEKAGGTKDSLKKEIKKIKEEKKKKEQKQTEENQNIEDNSEKENNNIESEEVSNEEVNNNFGIEFDIDENEDENNELLSYDGNFNIEINENTKIVNIIINSSDKKLKDFIQRQIENFYIDKGYTID